VGDDDGNGVGVCANKDCAANKRMIAVVNAWMPVLGSARVSRVGFGVSPKQSFLFPE